MELEELEEREQIYITQLKSALERSRELELQLARLSAAKSDGAPQLAASPTGATNDKVAELSRERDELAHALEQAQKQREVDLQRTAAYWLDRLAGIHGPRLVEPRLRCRAPPR